DGLLRPPTRVSEPDNTETEARVPGSEREVLARRPVRRPSAVVRGLLLDSARRLFAARGYAGASTREIAADAGVNEALIFRHFGNKVGLFRAAVVEPFRALID